MLSNWVRRGVGFNITLVGPLGTGSKRKLMHWHRRVAALFVILVLGGCAPK